MLIKSTKEHQNLFDCEDIITTSFLQHCNQTHEKMISYCHSPNKHYKLCWRKEYGRFASRSLVKCHVVTILDKPKEEDDT